MPRLIETPTIVKAAGTHPKVIEEFSGRASTGHDRVSVAWMKSPAGWEEPGQTPEFEEITVVLKGVLRVEHRGGVFEARAGQAVVAKPDEWVRYSTPDAEGAEYIAVCMPAFQSPTSSITKLGPSSAGPWPKSRRARLPCSHSIATRA